MSSASCPSSLLRSFCCSWIINGLFISDHDIIPRMAPRPAGDDAVCMFGVAVICCSYLFVFFFVAAGAQAVGGGGVGDGGP